MSALHRFAYWLRVNRVARKLFGRLGLLLVIFVAAWSIAWQLFARSADDAKYHRLGTAYLGYDLRAECFLIRDERARVVDSGLVDGRGILMADDLNSDNTETAEQAVYVADAWQGVYRLHLGDPPSLIAPKDRRLLLANATQVCPEGYCERADYGGLLEHPKYRLVLSDAHRQQLLVPTGSGYFEPAAGGPVLGSVRDVAWIPEQGAFLAAIADAPNETPPGGGSGDRRTGEITWVSDEARNQTPPSITGLRRPVGVTWSTRTRRLYVADVDGTNEIWSYYARSDDGWRKAGTLWRQNVGAFGPSIHLQDMVVADFDYVIEARDNARTCGAAPADNTQADRGAKEEVVVSAGPDGLYFFHSDGSLLAKYYIGRPVAGLAWGPVDSATGSNWLYFTSGPQIAALKTRLKDPQRTGGNVAIAATR